LNNFIGTDIATDDFNNQAGRDKLQQKFKDYDAAHEKDPVNTDYDYLSGTARTIIEAENKKAEQSTALPQQQVDESVDAQKILAEMIEVSKLAQQYAPGSQNPPSPQSSQGESDYVFDYNTPTTARLQKFLAGNNDALNEIEQSSSSAHKAKQEKDDKVINSNDAELLAKAEAERAAEAKRTEKELAERQASIAAEKEKLAKKATEIFQDVIEGEPEDLSYIGQAKNKAFSLLSSMSSLWGSAKPDDKNSNNPVLLAQDEDTEAERIAKELAEAEARTQAEKEKVETEKAKSASEAKSSTTNSTDNVGVVQKAKSTFWNLLGYSDETKGNDGNETPPPVTKIAADDNIQPAKSAVQIEAERLAAEEEIRKKALAEKAAAEEAAAKQKAQSAASNDTGAPKGNDNTPPPPPPAPKYIAAPNAAPSRHTAISQVLASFTLNTNATPQLTEAQKQEADRAASRLQSINTAVNSGAAAGQPSPAPLFSQAANSAASKPAPFSPPPATAKDDTPTPLSSVVKALNFNEPSTPQKAANDKGKEKETDSATTSSRVESLKKAVKDSKMLKKIVDVVSSSKDEELVGRVILKAKAKKQDAPQLPLIEDRDELEKIKQKLEKRTGETLDVRVHQVEENKYAYTLRQVSKIEEKTKPKVYKSFIKTEEEARKLCAKEREKAREEGRNDNITVYQYKDIATGTDRYAVAEKKLQVSTAIGK
jgi:hypothetical protein